MLIVPGTGHGGGRKRSLDAIDVRWRQRDPQGSERFCQLRAISRADQRDDGGTLREHPGNRQLRGCRMLLRCQLSKRADETLVLLEVLAREAWQIARKSPRAFGFDPLNSPRESTP